MAEVKVIYGAPCSGKSTYVREHAGPDDIVWDFDEIRRAVTLKEAHANSSDAQNKIVGQLRYAFIKNCAESEAKTAYVICTKPNDTINEFLGDLAEYIEMDATEEECLERLEKDDTRKDKEFFAELIHKYFEEKEEKSSFFNAEERGKKMEKEIRSFAGNVGKRSADDGMIHLTGMPVVFNQRTDIGGWFEEVIEPGAIEEKTLRDVCLLVNHDFNGIPLARSRNNTANSNLRLSIQGNEGVSMDSDLDPKNPKVIELDSAVERGDVSGMSFAFVVDGEQWERLDSDYPLRRVTHISEIFEVSAVTWPAYSGTSIQSERSLDSSLESLKRAREELESARARSEKIAGLNKRLKELNHE